ncbi:hypothetical protein C7974DRAFT_410530 [Boeremia exigua]|uniref:uncharacterized protein n=1 Tax=Boeremia exigua TaxID=749465 RepID=UPI001E8CBD46|nr:uncharacterized protein C7974DRAFT_410530 [Boeremia exigua]KAH6639570.1 hypothetical protein C7974DRAFT_410530 [Boeremia exigua]
MAVHKHSITDDWTTQTLVPFLYYAFASTLPYPADISDHIRRAIDFCLQKPDHPSDGDDLIFERVFMAIMHRHKNLAPDLEMVVDNLEPLAKYLIRRAQLKGPYELLDRSDIGSDAWIEYEQQRRGKLVIEPKAIQSEQLPPMRSSTAPSKAPPAEDNLDPRLVHAQPGHFTATYFPTQLTTDEDRHYRRQNRDYEYNRAHKQQKQIHGPIVSTQSRDTSHGRSNIDRISTFAQSRPHALHEEQHQRPPQVPAYVHHRPQDQAVPPRQITPTTQWPLQERSRQPRPEPSSYYPDDTVMKLGTTTQYTQRQTQPAQHPSTQHQSILSKAVIYSEVQPQPSQLVKPSGQHPSFCQPLPRLPPTSKNFPPSRFAPVPIPLASQPRATVPSSDFTHLRGNDWSNAAQQRAREVAAKITKWEQEVTTQEMMRHQQAIAPMPSNLNSTSNMYSPNGSSYTLPPRSTAAMTQSTASAYAHAQPVSSATYAPPTPAARTWGKALPDHFARPILPKPEEVRSRYHTPQQKPYTVPPLLPTLRAQQMQAPFQSQGQMSASFHAQNVKMHTPLPAVEGVQADAFSQLQCAAASSDAVLAQPELGAGLGEFDMRALGALEDWLRKNGGGSAKADGV